MSKLNAIRYNSFYLEDELVSKYLNIYFLINKKWYVCNAEDGEAIFLEIEYPKLISLAEIENEFKYPLFNLNDSEIIKNCIHQNIKSIEIISIGPLEIPENEIGYQINFENGNYLIVHDNFETTELLVNREIVRKGFTKEELVKTELIEIFK